jgi:hypothetical protein
MLNRLFLCISGVLALAMFAPRANGEDIDWNFSKRLETLEKKNADLERRVAAIEAKSKGLPSATAPVTKSTGYWKTVCGAGECSRVWVPTASSSGVVSGPTKSGSFVPDWNYQDLPVGYVWRKTPNGHGIAGPDGNWYLEPSTEYTSRLDAGYWYVPMPEANNWPRGYWASPCIKDENCQVVSCDVRPIGQHGEPTVQGRARSMGESFHPNNHPYGQMRVLTGCDRNAPPVSAGAVGGCSTCGIPVYTATPVVRQQYSFQQQYKQSYITGPGHTHTCPFDGTTWGGPGHGHNCPTCGYEVTMQDGGGFARGGGIRGGFGFRNGTGPVRRFFGRIFNR